MPPDRPPVPPEPDCRGCLHAFITYDPRQPRGCRAYGFKSRELPARVVRRVSGRPCRLFAARRRSGRGA